MKGGKNHEVLEAREQRQGTIIRAHCASMAWRAVVWRTMVQSVLER